MSMTVSSAAPFVRRAPGRFGGPAGPVVDLLAVPGSVRASSLLMQDVVTAVSPNVAAPKDGSFNRQVALFSNPFLNGQEEALVINEKGELTYLRRADNETGWDQTAAVAGGPQPATEVVVVVHPQDLSIWAIHCELGQRPRALRLVAQIANDVTTCSWQAMPDAIDYSGLANDVYGVTLLTVGYDGRNPCIGGVGLSGKASWLVVGTPIANGQQRFRFASIRSPAAHIDDLVVRRPRKLGASLWMPVFFLRSGDVLTWFDPASDASKKVASGVSRLLGAFPSSATGDVGCLYLALALDASKDLVALYPTAQGAGTFDQSTMNGLGLATASAWLDVNEMMHVYGVSHDQSHTLKVLHQESWAQAGYPVWSVVWDEKIHVNRPLCVGLVPGVPAFALDPFPDELPSQLVRSVTGQDAEFAFATQGITSARWSRDKIRLPSIGAEPHLVTNYTSSVTLLDRRGTPMPGFMVRVSAESLAEIQVDGVSYLVGPGHSVAVTTDPQGKVVVATPADSLAPATLHVDATGLPNGAFIQPAAAVHRYLGGTGTLPSQRGMFDDKALIGSGIVEPGHQDSVTAVVQGVKDVFGLAEGRTPANSYGVVIGPRPGARPNAQGVHVVEYHEFVTAEEYAAHQAAIAALPEYGGVWQDFAAWAGDVWQGIKNGVIEIYKVGYKFAEKVVEISIKIPGAIVKLGAFIVDTVQAAVTAVQALFRQIVADVGKVVDWLKALFSFADIWQTKMALTTGTTTVLRYGLSTIEHYGHVSESWIRDKKAEAKTYFDNLRTAYAGRLLGDARNQLPAMTDGSGAALSPNVIRDSPQGGWMFQQATGPKVLAARLQPLSRVPHEVKAIDEAWTDLLKAIGTTNIVQATSAHLGDLDALMRGVADPADPAAASKASMVALIDTLEKLIDLAFDTLFVLQGAIVAFAKAGAAGLDELLRLPLTDLAPLDGLYRWIQRQAGVTEDAVESLTLGGLLFLLPAFPVTIGYKLVNGVGAGPFPGGAFPPVAAPPWHSAHDPGHTIRDDPKKLNDDYRKTLIACGAAGLVGTVAGGIADVLPLFTNGGYTRTLDLVTGIATTGLGSIMFGMVSACPPVTGTAWDAAGGTWTVAFGIAGIGAAAAIGAIGSSIVAPIPQKDSSILRNIKAVELGPVLSTVTGLGFMIPSGMACRFDPRNPTNPYTTAMILLSGVSSATQVFRIGLRPGKTTDAIRGGVVAAVNAASSGVSSAMLTAAADLARAEIYPNQVLVATKGKSYRAEIQASGARRVFTDPCVWTLVGQLPAGLSFDRNNGVIYGTPTVTGSSMFDVSFVSSFGPPQYAAAVKVTLRVES